MISFNPLYVSSVVVIWWLSLRKRKDLTFISDGRLMPLWDSVTIRMTLRFSSFLWQGKNILLVQCLLIQLGAVAIQARKEGKGINNTMGGLTFELCVRNEIFKLALFWNRACVTVLEWMQCKKRHLCKWKYLEYGEMFLVFLIIRLQRTKQKIIKPILFWHFLNDFKLEIFLHNFPSF